MKRGGIWYVEAIVGGRRIKRSLKTRRLEEAIERRDGVLREALGQLRRGPQPEVPTFAEIVPLALAASVKEHAATYHDDHKRNLAPDGPVLPRLGSLPINRIDGTTLREWWEASVRERGWSTKTARNCLASIAWVFEVAIDCGHLEPEQKEAPFRKLRRTLWRQARTKQGRAERDQRKRAKDRVLTPEQLGRLMATAETQGPESEAMVLLAAECGLRLGELAALQWGDIDFGKDEDDTDRVVVVRRTASRRSRLEPTKAGRQREPWLSRRLRRVLIAVRRHRVSAEAEDSVLAWRYDGLIWKLDQLVKLAGLEHTTFQNLRATANTLLRQWGVNVEAVREIIGHEGEAVASEHYTGKRLRGYRPPELLAEGELPTDLFARLCRAPEAQKSHHKSHHPKTGARKAPRLKAVGWCPQRDSNPLWHTAPH